MKQQAGSEGKRTAAQVTRDYIGSRPALRQILLNGLINHSALARRIMEEEGQTNEEAVTSALRRLVQEEAEQRVTEGRDEAINDLLSDSNLNMKNKIASITAKGEWLVLARLEKLFKGLLGQRVLLQVILGTEGLTIITEEKMVDDIVKVLGSEHVLKVRKGLAEVAVRCPPRIEDTPGVVAHLSDLLSQRGINVVEMVSCYTDVIFIVEERDIMESYEILGRRFHS
jgi:hypothetical protein